VQENELARTVLRHHLAGCWHAGRYDGSEVAVKVMQLLAHQAHAPLSEINPLSLSHPGVVRHPARSPLHGPLECCGLGR